MFQKYDGNEIFFKKKTFQQNLSALQQQREQWIDILVESLNY